MPANSGHGFERFLTLADVADILNVALDDARSLVETNELAAIRIGTTGQWRVEQRALEDYVQDQYERQRREAMFDEFAFDDIPELSIQPEDLDAR